MAHPQTTSVTPAGRRPPRWGRRSTGEGGSLAERRRYSRLPHRRLDHCRDDRGGWNRRTCPAMTCRRRYPAGSLLGPSCVRLPSTSRPRGVVLALHPYGAGNAEKPGVLDECVRYRAADHEALGFGPMDYRLRVRARSCDDLVDRRRWLCTAPHPRYEYPCAMGNLGDRCRARATHASIISFLGDGSNAPSTCGGHVESCREEFEERAAYRGPNWRCGRTRRCP